MGTDRDLFSEGEEGLPVFEGRMIDAYDYRAKGYVSGHGRSAVWQDLPFGSSDKRIQPQWRILSERVPKKLDDRTGCFRITYCKVASPTNARTMYCAVVPKNSVCGDVIPTIVLTGGSVGDLLLWVGCANSMAIDYIVRFKTALHVTFTILDSIPFPRNFRSTRSSREIARRVCALCAVGSEMKTFREMAVNEGILTSVNDVVEDPDQRAILAAEIDVLVARDVYGLSRKKMTYILDPANVLGEDSGFETFKALRNREMREFGEYRTQRLILDAWERLEAGCEFKAMGM